MTKSKRKKLNKQSVVIVVMAIAMVAMLAFGGVYAYFTATSNYLTTTITTGYVKLTTGSAFSSTTTSSILPGDNILQGNTIMYEADILENSSAHSDSTDQASSEYTGEYVAVQISVDAMIDTYSDSDLSTKTGSQISYTDAKTAIGSSTTSTNSAGESYYTVNSVYISAGAYDAAALVASAMIGSLSFDGLWLTDTQIVDYSNTGSTGNSSASSANASLIGSSIVFVYCGFSDSSLYNGIIATSKGTDNATATTYYPLVGDGANATNCDDGLAEGGTVAIKYHTGTTTDDSGNITRASSTVTFTGLQDGAYDYTSDSNKTLKSSNSTAAYRDGTANDGKSYYFTSTGETSNYSTSGNAVACTPSSSTTGPFSDLVLDTAGTTSSHEGNSTYYNQVYAYPVARYSTEPSKNDYGTGDYTNISGETGYKETISLMKEWTLSKYVYDNWTQGKQYSDNYLMEVTLKVTIEARSIQVANNTDYMTVHEISQFLFSDSYGNDYNGAAETPSTDGSDTSGASSKYTGNNRYVGSTVLSSNTFTYTL